MRNFSDKNCRENQNTYFTTNNIFFFFENRAVYEIMWDNIVERGRSEITNIIRRMRIARWITKATKYTLRMCSTSGAYALAFSIDLNPLNPELNPICYSLALLGAHHFLHVSRIRVKLLTFRLLMSYIYIYIYVYGAPILDVSRSHTTTQHSR